MADKPNFYPDIFQYLENSDYEAVEIDSLEELVYLLHASTEFTVEQCRIIVRAYFAEMRARLMRQGSFQAGNLFTLQLNKKGSWRPTVSLHPSPSLAWKINEASRSILD